MAQKKDAPVEMGIMIYYLTITYALLFAAIWQVVQGDWLPAIFLAVFWVGHTNNVGNTIGNRAAMWRWKKEAGING